MCTRFTIIDIIKDITSKTITNSFINKWKKNIQINPKYIICDLGRQYTGKEFKAMAEKNKITIIYTSVNNPTGNGISERINKNINEVIRRNTPVKNVNELKNKILIKLNLNYNRVIRTTPFELNLNINPLNNTKTDNKIKLLEEANKSSQIESYKNIERINSKRKDYTFKTGDLIYTKNRTSLKQDRPWNGPYFIIDTKENRVKINKGNVEQWINIKNIKINPIKEGENVVIDDQKLQITNDAEDPKE